MAHVRDVGNVLIASWIFTQSKWASVALTNFFFIFQFDDGRVFAALLMFIGEWENLV